MSYHLVCFVVVVNSACSFVGFFNLASSVHCDFDCTAVMATPFVTDISGVHLITRLLYTNTSRYLGQLLAIQRLE
jgi:hypothetical protein